MNAPVLAISPANERQQSIRRAIDEWRHAETLCTEKILALALELKAGRDEFDNNSAFSEWLDANGCSDLVPHDRAALLNMADHIDMARKVLEVTKRRSVRLIWDEEIKPLVNGSAGNTRSSAATHEYAGCRIKVPGGLRLSEIARKGLAMLNSGMKVPEVKKQLGLSNQAFWMAKDIVLLADRDDLSAEDAALVKEAFLEMDRERQIRAPWVRIRPIAERVWGKKGNRLKGDKRRFEKFDQAISQVLGLCENAAEIDIPYITKVRADEKTEKLEEAVGLLHRLMERIKENAHG